MTPTLKNLMMKTSPTTIPMQNVARAQHAAEIALCARVGGGARAVSTRMSQKNQTTQKIARLAEVLESIANHSV